MNKIEKLQQDVKLLKESVALLERQPIYSVGDSVVISDDDYEGVHELAGETGTVLKAWSEYDSTYENVDCYYHLLIGKKLVENMCEGNLMKSKKEL